MSRITVLDPGQPIKHISRSSAHRLELTGYYERRGRTLHRLAIRRPITSFTVGKSSSHIPNRLPPVDLPGLKFIKPKPHPSAGTVLHDQLAQLSLSKRETVSRLRQAVMNSMNEPSFTHGGVAAEIDYLVTNVIANCKLQIDTDEPPEEPERDPEPEEDTDHLQRI